MAKLCLKPHEAAANRVTNTAVHTIDLDPFSRLFIELPICTIEQINEFIGRLAAQLYILGRFNV